MPCINASAIIDTIYINIYKIIHFHLFYLKNARDWEMSTIIYLLRNV